MRRTKIRYGPTVIRKCSECSGLIEEHTISSGNTCCATLWTDGKRDTPMLPDLPWIVKCPHCQCLVWLNELEQAEGIEPGGDDGACNSVKSYDTPELQDYLSELEKREYGRRKEQYLRVRAWWAGNDRRRDTGDEKQDLSDDEISNLLALGRTLNPADDNDRIRMAEIKRELGRFEDAEVILMEPVNDDLSEVASFIRELILNRQSIVAEMIIEK